MSAEFRLSDEHREARAVEFANLLGIEKHEGHLRGLWLDLAEKRIEDGVDWPGVVRTLFRDLDRLARFRKEREAAERALVERIGKFAEQDLERLKCPCGHRAHRHFDFGCGGPTKFKAGSQCECKRDSGTVVITGLRAALTRPDTEAIP